MDLLFRLLRSTGLRSLHAVASVVGGHRRRKGRRIRAGRPWEPWRGAPGRYSQTMGPVTFSFRPGLSVEPLHEPASERSGREGSRQGDTAHLNPASCMRIARRSHTIGIHGTVPPPAYSGPHRVSTSAMTVYRNRSRDSGTLRRFVLATEKRTSPAGTFRCSAPVLSGRDVQSHLDWRARPHLDRLLEFPVAREHVQHVASWRQSRQHEVGLLAGAALHAQAGG